MEKDNVNKDDLLPYRGDSIPRLDAVGDSNSQPIEIGGGSSPLAKFVWLIGGFNLGFIMLLAGAFFVSDMDNGFRIQASTSDETAQVVITQTASVTLETSPTSLDAVNTLVADASIMQSTEITTEVTALPSATLEPTTDLKATARANNRLTQEAAFALTPSATATLFPTQTPIPPTSTPLPPEASYFHQGVSFYRQGWNNCGPANLAMGLSYFSWQGSQDDTANFLKPNREDKNVTPQQMVEYVNRFTNLRAIWRMAGTIDQLQWLTNNGFMVIVESGYEPRGEGWFGHYETVVGYDDSRNTVTIYDSYLGSSSRPSITYGETQFDLQWQSFNRNYLVIYAPAREAELRTYLGSDWNERSNRVRAVQVAQEEASADPSNEFAWFNLGTSLTAIGRYEEAVAAYNRALEIGLPYRMLWYQYGPYEAFIQTGRFSEALELANNTLKTTTYVEETYYYKGRAYELSGDYAAALVEYQNALNFNPNHSQAQQSLERVSAYQ